MQPGTVVGEAAEDNAGNRRCRGQRANRRRDRYSSGATGGETIDAGRNGRKGNRSKTAGLAEFDRAAIA